MSKSNKLNGLFTRQGELPILAAASMMTKIVGNISHAR